ncbi:sulfotransferase domain-containing protein [Nonomuraea terrae]|uniref:sulfotransferase domain-containing protein n=1 Tax=Nonomuraea terrae TaxID=2530383 RepID=UPI00378E5A9F
MSPLVQYTNAFQESGRWHAFPFRQGDIVISTHSKSGTTWMQMICALLVFQTADLPEPLPVTSPWLDHRIVPHDEVLTRLEAQRHRRFIKTHTPLDGIPNDARVTYIVVARHPLDMAVSLYHHARNLDVERIRALTNQPEPARPPAPALPLRDWLLHWMDKDVPPLDDMDSLPGVMRHLSDAWERRLRQPNVVLVHYDDLLTDLAGEMRELARALNISVPENIWPTLVKAATFDTMKSRADSLAPNTGDVLKDAAAFFHRGASAAGRVLLNDDELARYQERTRRLAPPDLLEWLHRH